MNGWARLVSTLALLTMIYGCGEQRLSPVTSDSGTPGSAGGTGIGDRWTPPVDVFLRDGIAESGVGGVKDYSIIKANGKYHVFYIHNPRRGWQVYPNPGEDRFGHAISTDLRQWTLLDPIELREPTYSHTNIWAPHVFEEDGVYYMFYTGVNWGPEVYPDHPQPAYNTQRILLATSTDLYTWTRYGDTGLILDGPANTTWSAWGDGGTWVDDCRDPFVFNDGGQYVMFVSVKQENGLMALATATAPDLFNWTWQGVLPETEQDTGPGWHGAESANVTKYGNLYYLMWTDDSMKVAYSTSIMGPYTLMDPSMLYGYANEVLREPTRIIYGAIVNDFELQFKKLMLTASTPSVRIHNFNEDDFPSPPPYIPYEPFLPE